MNLSPTMTKIIHVALVVLVLVGGLGPTLATLTPLLPPAWATAIAHVIATASALVLYLAQSPLFAPLLPTKSPETVITSEKIRAVKLASAATAALVGVFCMFLVACNGLFGKGVEASGSDVAPILTCVEDTAMADTSPSTTTIEAAVTACGVAAADVASTVAAIEALAATPAVNPVAGAKILRMKHAPAKAVTQ